MPTPSTIRDWSTTAASNSPAGSENSNTADDYLRSFAAIIRQGDSEGTIASAGTCDLGSVAARHITVTGTTTITSFGTTAAAGEWKILRFSGALTLTYNATSLILPGAASITTAANDCAIARCLGSGNWIVVGFTRFAQVLPAAAGTTGQFLRGDGSYSNTIAATAGTGFIVNGVAGQVNAELAATESRLRLSASSGRTFEVVSGGGSLVAANTFGIYDVSGSALRYSISSAGAHTFAVPSSGATVVTVNTSAPGTASDRAVQINGSNVGDVRLGIQSATTGNAQFHLDTAGVQNWSISNVRSDGSFRITNSQTPGTSDRYTISTAGAHTFTGNAVITAGLTVNASGASITGNTSVAGGTFTTRGFVDNATSAAWNIDSSGRLVNNGATQPRLRSGAASVGAMTSSTPITTFTSYGASSYDVGSAFNASTGVWTCPVTGTYALGVAWTANSSAVNTTVAVWIDDGVATAYAQSQLSAPSSATAIRNASSETIRLTAGQQLTVKIVVPAGSISSAGIDRFTAVLLFGG